MIERSDSCGHGSDLKGIFGANPVTRLQDRIIAPGAIDCKGGIAIALLTMKALKKHGYKKHLRLRDQLHLKKTKWSFPEREF
jgi:hypothetical protein